MNEILRKLPIVSTIRKWGWMIEWSCKCYSRGKGKGRKWVKIEEKGGKERGREGEEPLAVWDATEGASPLGVSRWRGW